MANRHNITFNTEADYLVFKASSRYVEPNVSYVTETNSVHYNPLSSPSHEYVDLGLPSGTKWATMNVGANSITDYGNYYQYGKGASTIQVTSGDSIYSGTEDPLAASADTATVEWGGEWHMPTSAQCQELFDNTTYQWVTNYQGSGVNGSTFTANGQTLFIPAAGYYYNSEINKVGYDGSFWSSTPISVEEAYIIETWDGDLDINYEIRSVAVPVRPVLG